jgi:NADPH:quinone reductase-like Zn-dependent oxidoreductase
MKAIVYTEYGSPDVLHLKEVAKPAPRENEVLIRVHATPVGFGDLLARKFKSVTPRQFNMPFFFWLPARLAFGLNKPKKNILGSEFAGEVEAVGKAVTRFKPGDQVFGFTANLGAYAEYICLPEEGVAARPANLNFAEAAAVPYGALTALYFLKKANLQSGQKVLIVGASGGVGTAAVQLAKHFGAEVTGVCSTAKLEFVKALGADVVIDYTREDFTRNGQIYDVIFDTVGKSSVLRSNRSLKENGYYLFATFGLPTLALMPWLSLRSKQKAVVGLVEAKCEALNFIKELIEAGEFKAVIDRCYPMDQMADAHRYVETGRKKGSVVITLT